MNAQNDDSNRDESQKLDQISEKFGKKLKKARKSKNIDATELARSLKMTATQLRWLEEGQGGRLGPAVYLSGYLRAVGRATDINVDEALAEIKANDDAKLVHDTTIVQATRENWHRPHRIFGYVAATALVAVPLAFAVLYGFQGNFGGTEEASDQDGSPVAASMTAMPNLNKPLSTESATDSLRDGDAVLQSGLEASEAPAEAEAAPQSEGLDVVDAMDTESDAVSSEDDVETRQFRLELSEPAWMSVETMAGERLEYGLVSAGAILEFPTSRGLVIKLGNADAVTASLGGEAFDLAAVTRNELAKFSIPATL